MEFFTSIIDIRFNKHVNFFHKQTSSSDNYQKTNVINTSCYFFKTTSRKIIHQSSLELQLFLSKQYTEIYIEKHSDNISKQTIKCVNIISHRAIKIYTTDRCGRSLFLIAPFPQRSSKFFNGVITPLFIHNNCDESRQIRSLYPRPRILRTFENSTRIIYYHTFVNTEKVLENRMHSVRGATPLHKGKYPRESFEPLTPHH